MKYYNFTFLFDFFDLNLIQQFNIIVKMQKEKKDEVGF